MKILRPTDKVNPPAVPVTPPDWLFKPVERPSFTDSLKFPDDITKLVAQDVGRLFGQYTGLFAYATSELAHANIFALRIRSEMHVRKNNITRTGQTYNKNKHAIDVMVRSDKALEQLQLRLDKAEEKIIELTAVVAIFDRYASTLSRELTRRAGEMQRT